MNGDDKWSQMYSGIAFSLTSPKAEDVRLVDIAHSLSLQCRYAGHVNRFYSVAEHCIIMSKEVSVEAAPYALLHDAGEAYVGDIPSPVKCQLAGIKELEQKLMAVIYKAFRLSPPTEKIVKEIKKADLAMLKLERDTFMKKPPKPWAVDSLDVGEIKSRLSGLNWEQAEIIYMAEAVNFDLMDCTLIREMPA